MESLNNVMMPMLARLKSTALGVESEPVASRGDSALEERFWSLIEETVGGRDRSLDQFEIGGYRVDSIFLVPQGAVVIELDGEQFHKDRVSDYKRDTQILKSVFGVIRIRYYDLMAHPRSTFYTIGRFYPRFMPNGLPNFTEQDSPDTAQLLGISWRQSCNKNRDIIRRIEQGQRKKNV